MIENENKETKSREPASFWQLLFPNKKSAIMVSTVAAVMILITVFAIIYANRNKKPTIQYAGVEVIQGLAGTTVDPKIKEMAEKGLTEAEKEELYGQYDVEMEKQETAEVEVKADSKGGDIKISKKEITTDGMFYNYITKNGVFMQLIFLKGPDNRIRVAVNTSEECKGEPDAYFERGYGIFKCKHCGRVVADAEVGLGINEGAPIKVEYENGLTSITVAEETLLGFEDYFTNWKGAEGTN